MRCDQCKHWQKAEPPHGHDWESASVGFGLCLAVRPRWKIQDEASQDIPYDSEAISPWDEDAGSKWATARKEALKRSRAYVQDGSQYVAQLVTGPDFGCVLHEPRAAAINHPFERTEQT